VKKLEQMTTEELNWHVSEPASPEPSAPPLEELKEILELRVLARMASEHPCFTNAILAVTDAYTLGYKAGLRRASAPPINKPESSAPSKGEARKKSSLIIEMPPQTYNAKLFSSPWEGKTFKLAGTLDGFIDLAVPKGGTYPLSLEEARSLVDALNIAITDVQTRCLFEKDSLLPNPKEEEV
jgi:hypothetical protein